MTDTLGQSQVLPYLIGLSQRGWLFHIISCEKPQRFEKERLVIDAIVEANGIKWHPLPYTKSPPVLSTINDVRRMKKKAVTLQKQHGFAVVHCRSYVASLVGLHLKQTFGLKYIFDMRGFWADEKVDAGQWNLKNPFYRAVYNYFKKKEAVFVQQADGIVSLTHKGVSEMLKWKHVKLAVEKVKVIPCCVDTVLFDRNKVTDEERIDLKSQLGLQGKTPIISYLGSIGTWYMLEEMLDFFVAIKSRHPQAIMLFITHDEHGRIKTSAAAKELKPEDIVIKPASRQEVPVLLSISSYSLFFIRPTYSKSASSPTKQGEVMAMGVPVICNAGVGDTDDIVNRYDSGVVIQLKKTDDHSTYVDALAHRSFNSAAIRQGAVAYFSLDRGVGTYAELYAEILR